MTVDESHVGWYEKSLVDFVELIELDLLDRIDLELLEVTRGKSLDLSELPVVRELQDGRPFVDVSIVNRVLPGGRSMLSVMKADIPDPVTQSTTYGL